jgi:hypothetical protein
MAAALTLEVSARRVALVRGDGPAIDARDVSGDSMGEELAQVAAMLCSQAAPRTVHARLASGVARLILLPWLEQLSNEDRWRNYASGRFEQTYGDSLEHWDLRFAEEWPGRGRLAVAWPRPLRDALLPMRNVRSARVELLEFLRYLVRHEPGFTGCLAEFRDDGAGLLLLREGALQRARWRRFGDGADLANAIRTEWASVAAGAGAQAVLALAPPVPERGSDLERSVVQLAQALGASRVFTLPAGAGRGTGGRA